MAYAVCKECGKQKHWFAGKGASLADVRCDCGGEMHGKGAGREGATKGKKFNVCVLCEKKRIDCEPIGFDFQWVNYPNKEYRSDKVYPSGSMLCAWHRGHTDAILPPLV